MIALRWLASLADDPQRVLKDTFEIGFGCVTAQLHWLTTRRGY